jgi:hypothetical protein
LSPPLPAPCLLLVLRWAWSATNTWPCRKITWWHRTQDIRWGYPQKPGTARLTSWLGWPGARRSPHCPKKQRRSIRGSMRFLRVSAQWYGPIGGCTRTLLQLDRKRIAQAPALSIPLAMLPRIKSGCAWWLRFAVVPLGEGLTARSSSAARIASGRKARASTRRLRREAGEGAPTRGGSASSQASQSARSRTKTCRLWIGARSGPGSVVRIVKASPAPSGMDTRRRSAHRRTTPGSTQRFFPVRQSPINVSGLFYRETGVVCF